MAGDDSKILRSYGKLKLGNEKGRLNPGVLRFGGLDLKLA